MDRVVSIAKVIFVGVLICALYSAICYADKKDKDPPKFHVHKTSVDIGDVYEGRDIVYTYKVRNNGVGELHIINVRPG